MRDHNDDTESGSTLPGIFTLPEGDNDRQLRSSPSNPVQGDPTLKASEYNNEVTSGAPSPVRGNTDGSAAHHVESLLAYLRPYNQESFTCETHFISVDGISEDIPIFSLFEKDGNCLITIVDLTKVDYDLSDATALSKEEVRPAIIDVPAHVSHLKRKHDTTDDEPRKRPASVLVEDTVDVRA